ncbi:hypothetical protein KR222_008160 [Zaprionus bogoriensis]|nr:hypothetical protein KR222_008160 [Zaprionus bogoriensis]
MFVSLAVVRSRYKLPLIIVLGLCFLTYVSYPSTMTSRDFEPELTTQTVAIQDVVSVANEEQATTTLPKFYVESEHCKIPYIDPFSPDAMEVYVPEQFETCSNQSDLVTPLFDVTSKRYVLHIDEKVAALALNSIDVEFNCFYQEIKRQTQDDTYKNLEAKVYFSQGYVVPVHVQGMILECHEAANTSNVIQRDGLAFVQYQPLTTAKPVREGTTMWEETPRKPSVIMFGIDSISRINLRRTMPKVYKFLTQSGWYEMQGYNKVADNTFPNLMAILSGYLPDSGKEQVCDTDTKGCFDQFPFIWKFLKSAGYLTAYAEDEFGLNTFNYLKPGFVNPPTDYYYRPLLNAFSGELEMSKCGNCTMTYCIGRRVQCTYVYDYCREFAKRYAAERPIWGLFWSTSFSHDSFSLPSKMDDMIEQYLQDFEADGVLSESIVVFFADHGARYGTLSFLSSGFLEERLPMLFIYLPPWFRERYPQYARALHLNRNRLTSNFDLHNTLKHIIELGQSEDSPGLPLARDCPQCHSLFYPANATRSCPDAGIHEHYCTCQPYKRISTDWSRRIVPLIIERMNDYLWAKNLSGLCANLTLSYIHKIEMKLGLDHDFHGELPVLDEALYRTKFKVQQNSADFFATVVFNNVTQHVDVDVEMISRTNSYADDSTCIDDKIAKLYCICHSLLRP